MGFCRTNLFKRLESSGQAFIQSIERHILRNFVYLHAIETGLPLPIGTQDASLLDARFTDVERDLFSDDEENDDEASNGDRRQVTAWERKHNFANGRPKSTRNTRARGSGASAGSRRLASCRSSPKTFKPTSASYSVSSTDVANGTLAAMPSWLSSPNWSRRNTPVARSSCSPSLPIPLSTLSGNSRIAAFSASRLSPGIPTTRPSWHGGSALRATANATTFSPANELDVLIATDVLSEGQNLQDSAIIVNYDLPWAIIRLIQRAGRVDRIGQKSDEILCYSFLPADGVERIIRLRSRVRQRLRENAEVVGSDESFFEDDRNDDVIRDLFTEKAGILDGDADTEVDLGSYAYQIWKNAIDRDPTLQKTIPDLPNVVFSTRPHTPAAGQPEGVLAYVHTADGNDALAWLDKDGPARHRVTVRDPQSR